jgi:hypothetical protein
MAEELDRFEGLLAESLKEAVIEKNDCLHLLHQSQVLEMELKNMEIRHDID